MNTYATLYINTVRTYFLSHVAKGSQNHTNVLSELQLTVHPIETVLHYANLRTRPAYSDSSIAIATNIIHAME